MRYFLFSGNVFDAALLAIVTALKNCKKKNIICDTLFLFCFFIFVPSQNSLCVVVLCLFFLVRIPEVEEGKDTKEVVKKN